MVMFQAHIDDPAPDGFNESFALGASSNGALPSRPHAHRPLLRETVTARNQHPSATVSYYESDCK